MSKTNLAIQREYSPTLLEKGERLLLQMEEMGDLGIVENASGRYAIHFPQNITVEFLAPEGLHQVAGLYCNCEKGTGHCVHKAATVLYLTQEDQPNIVQRQRVARPGIRKIIDAIPEPDLKNFLTAYVQHNKELHSWIQFLFNSATQYERSEDEIDQQLAKVFHPLLHQLDKKKTQKKADFLMERYLGNAKDLVAGENYSVASQQILGLHKFVLRNSGKLSALPTISKVWETIENVLIGLSESDIAPALLDHIRHRTIENWKGPSEIRPFLSVPIPFRRQCSLEGNWEELEPILMFQVGISREPQEYLPLIFHRFHDLSHQHQNRLARRFSEISASELMHGIEKTEEQLKLGELMFLFRWKKRFTSEQWEGIAEQVKEEWKFLFQIHYSAFRGSTELVFPELKDATFSKTQISALDSYLAEFPPPFELGVILRYYVFQDEELPPEASTEQLISLLAFLPEEVQKKTLKTIKKRMLQYLEDHLGHPAKEKLLYWGRLLIRNGYRKEWEKVQRELGDSFRHRQSLRSLDPFHPQ